MKDELDTILQKWAAGKAKSEDSLRELTNRIILEVSRIEYEEYQNVSMVIPFFGKLGYAGLGAMVGILMCLFYLRVPLASVPATEQLVNASMLSDSEIAKKTRLFGEVERLFPDNLRWIAESDGDVGVGVETTEGAVKQQAVPVLVKLTALSRGVGEKNWRSVWATCVVVRGQELVEIRPNKLKENNLTLWVYPLADGKVAVDSNLALNSPVSLNSSMTAVVGQNIPSEVLYKRSGDVEYKVLQTVKVLSI